MLDLARVPDDFIEPATVSSWARPTSSCDGAEAWRRRFSGSHGNGRCVRLSPVPGPSELVGGVDRPQQPEGAEGSNLLHVVGQQRPRPTNAGMALLELHRGLP